MTQNIAASVHQRLLNCARAGGRPFNELLQYFALERFLYRLGCSPHQDQFVLKGALMFTVWQVPVPRPTRDIDLLGRMDNAVSHVVTAIQEICEQPVPEDGLRFPAETVVGERIIEMADYEGVRVRFTAYLGTARIPMQEGATLTQAIQATFLQRRTAITASPIAFSDAFARNPEKQAQWAAFLRRYRLSKEAGIPTTLYETVQIIASFLRPVLQALVDEGDFDRRWLPGGPWVAPGDMSGGS